MDMALRLGCLVAGVALFSGFSWPLCGAESDLILTESFESPARRAYGSGSIVAGWRVTGSIDICGEGFGMVGLSHTGAQGLEVNGDSPGTASTNLHTIEGKAYLFTFAFTKNPYITSARAAIEINGSSIAEILANQTNSPSALNWRIGSLKFTAVTTNSVLTLRGLEGGNAGVYFDTLEVRLTTSGIDVYVNDQLATNDSVHVRGEARVRLASSFIGGATLYTFDGSDPRVNGHLYSGEFRLRNTARIRAVAYNSDFSNSEERTPLDVFILPQVFARTEGGGTVSISPPDGMYDEGSTATLTATPGAGWSFLHWMGDVYSTAAGVTVTVTNDLCATAVFGTTISNSVIGSGSIHLNPAVAVYPYGAQLQATAVPQSASFFVQWGGDVSGTNGTISLTVTNPQWRLTGLFAALPTSSYALTTVPMGAGRQQVAPNANLYARGTNVSVTAIPDPQQTFLGWTGDATGTNNPLTVQITRNKVIYAMFSRSPRLALRSCGNAGRKGGFRMVLQGSLGDMLEIDHSANLSDWDSLLVMTNSAGRFEFIDVSPPQNRRFYRSEVLTPRLFQAAIVGWTNIDLSGKIVTVDSYNPPGP